MKLSPFNSLLVVRVERNRIYGDDEKSESFENRAWTVRDFGGEEWGKRQTGNGKGKHEVAGPV